MNKLIMAAAIVASVICGTGCSKESEFESLLREQTKDQPELIAKPVIEAGMAMFRELSSEDQAKAIEELKKELGK